MIYVLGDSFTWGYNFIFDKINKVPVTRLSKIYSTKLGKLLDQEVTNLSINGCSNWRIARIISSLELSENDFVVINWTDSMRLELGSSNSQMIYNKGNVPIIDQTSLQNLEENKFLNELKKDFPFGEFIEKDKSLYLRRIFPAMFTIEHNDKFNDDFIEFVKQMYTFYVSDKWCEDMFLLMFMATIYKLKTENAKFAMFNTFRSPYSKNSDMLDIPEYIVGYKSNMCNYLRNNDNIEYWDDNEHTKIAELLADYYKGKI